MSDFPALAVYPNFFKARSVRTPRSLAFFENTLSPIRLHRAVDLPSPNSHEIDEAPTDLIRKAVRQNDKNNLIRILKKRRAEPFRLLADNKNWTALHSAASKPEYKECLELLLEYDGYSILVDKDKQTNSGETALHIACIFGCEENALILLQNGCNAGKKTSAGYSALHIAAAKGYIRIVRYLLDYSVDIDSKDGKGCTPLHLAAEAGHSDISEILVANGANIVSVDDEGNLPLHLACKCGTFETARLLVERDSASINAKNSRGITPFMLAANHFDVHGIQYLLENGARTNICDNLGRTAIHFSASRKDIQIFSQLIQSTSENDTEQCCVSNIMQALNEEVYTDSYIFDSYTCLTIQMGVDYLNVLMQSHLPNSVLQMPSFHCGFTRSLNVYSPLAYLFFKFTSEKIIAFDQYLDLLLKHKITMTDEFQGVLQKSFPNTRLRFINPLSILLSSLWPNNNREHYFNLLLANNITTDYCLQCYHDNNKPFATFNEYRVYYDFLIYAVERGNLEVVKLLLSNSVILEPDILSNYLIIAYITKQGNVSSKDMEEARSVYRYLINLKPVYYKVNQNMYNLQNGPFLLAADNISFEVFFTNLVPNNFPLPHPVASEAWDSMRLLLPHILHRGSDVQLFPYITANEEFANVTLQQLCRTTIRQHLREATLKDNLQNFRRKILELPLPKFLKDYLLFKI